MSGDFVGPMKVKLSPAHIRITTPMRNRSPRVRRRYILLTSLNLSTEFSVSVSTFVKVRIGSHNSNYVATPMCPLLFLAGFHVT